MRLSPPSAILAVPAGALCALRVAGVVTAFALLAVAPSLQAQARAQKIAGVVVRLDGNTLDVQPAAGAVLAIRLAANFSLSGRSAADPAKLTDGAFVGVTAAAQPDGTLLASEVHLFPESLRGKGEGHRPMAEPGNTMTNATVASVSHGNAPPRATSNATLASVSAAPAGRMLTLAYKGGEKVIVVPDGVPVTMVEPVDRSALVPGAHVVVFATSQPDGTLLAERVTVGKNGFVPPL